MTSLLRSLNMVPIYDHKHYNDRTEDNTKMHNRCMEILKNNGALLVFPEGVTANNMSLAPLKKQTARMAYDAWVHCGLHNLIVQPVALHYDSFGSVPKQIQIRYAPVIRKEMFDTAPPLFYKDFNCHLYDSLTGALHTAASPTKHLNRFRIALALPALIGYIIHKPIYSLCRAAIKRKTKGTAFFDSVMVAVLAIAYPLLVLTITLIAVSGTNQYAYLLLVIFLPFTAWSYKEYKALKFKATSI